MSSSIGPDRGAPVRWSKALAKGDPLRDALRAAREVQAPPRHLDRVFASVVAIAPGGAGGGEPGGGPDIADGTGSGATATSGAHAVGKAAAVGKVAAAGAATGSGALAKALVVGVFGAASVGTAWWIGVDTPVVEAPTAVVMSAAPRVPSAEPVHVEQPQALERAAPSAAASSESAPGGGASASAAPDDRTEAALLREASAAVANDPNRAMQLVDEAERRFAHGSLGQERELIRVQALIAAGRRDEAVSRARNLLDRNPSSAHRPRLVQMLPELAN